MADVIRFVPRPRPTPQATIDAIMHCVRERGIGALREPANIERLQRCDVAARRQINSRIGKLVEQKAFHDDQRRGSA
jgi:hypothetical protein